MGINVKSCKLTATPGALGWVQAHEFTPQDSLKLKKRGSIYAVIATKNPQKGVETLSVGREIITRLHEEYYANLEKDAFVALQEASKKIKKEFESINPEIGVIAHVGDDLFVVGYGGVTAQVIREKSMVTLLESKEVLVAVSGKPNKGDIFLLGTKAFFENFEYDEIKKAFTEKGLEGSIEEFAPKVHASPNLGSAGFVALKFGEKKSLPQIEQVSLEEKSSPQVEKAPKPKPSTFFKDVLNKLPKKQIKLKNQNLEQATSQGRKTTLTAGAVLTVLLLVSVIFGLNQKKIKDQKNTYGTKLESAISDYNESLEMMELDVSKARELFLSAKEQLEEVQNSQYKDERISSLASDISEKQGEILGEYTVELENYLDLSLQTSGFEGSDLSSSGQEIFVLDSKNKKIIKVEIESKKASIAAGSDEVGSAIQIGSYEDRFFVLTDDGIFELGEGKERQVDKDWENPIFYVYSGNIYILEKNENIIYRYPGIQGGFGEKTNWLAPGIEPDFSKLTDITIDGSIWMLSSSGKVSRFTLGSPQSVSLNGLPQKMVNPKAIYTNEELEFVYILDPQQQRIVVLEKNGEFKVQYKAQGLKDVSDLVVSEEEGKIILLNGSKLLFIELKHL